MIAATIPIVYWTLSQGNGSPLWFLVGTILGILLAGAIAYWEPVARRDRRISRLQADAVLFDRSLTSVLHHQSFYPRGSKVWLSLQQDVENLEGPRDDNRRKQASL